MRAAAQRLADVAEPGVRLVVEIAQDEWLNLERLADVAEPGVRQLAELADERLPLTAGAGPGR